MITSLAALIFQSCLVKKVNSDLGTGIFLMFYGKIHNLWSIRYGAYLLWVILECSIAYPQKPLKYPLKAMNSPVNQAYGKLYMEKSSFDIKPFIRLFAILNLLFTIGLFITSLMTTSYAGYYGFYLPASNANEIHLGHCFNFQSG